MKKEIDAKPHTFKELSNIPMYAVNCIKCGCGFANDTVQDKECYSCSGERNDFKNTVQDGLLIVER